MTTTTPQDGTQIIPTMRYLDAPAAMDWLCKALGFERHLVVPGEADGEVVQDPLQAADRARRCDVKNREVGRVSHQ